MAAITDRANTAHGTFYLYFKNKEDVFCQVMETIIVGELAAGVEIPEAVTPREVLEHVIRGFLTAYAPHSALWRAVLEGAFQSERIKARWLELRRLLIERVIVGLEVGLEAGTIRRLQDPILTAHALSSMNEWFAFVQFEIGEPATHPAAIEPAVAVLVDLWYHALYGQVRDEDQYGLGPA